MEGLEDLLEERLASDDYMQMTNFSEKRLPRCCKSTLRNIRRPLAWTPKTGFERMLARVGRRIDTEEERREPPACSSRKRRKWTVGRGLFGEGLSGEGSDLRQEGLAAPEFEEEARVPMQTELVADPENMQDPPSASIQEVTPSVPDGAVASAGEG